MKQTLDALLKKLKPKKESVTSNLLYESAQNREQVCLHGTNAYALESMLKYSDGKVISGNKQKELGITPLTGESLGNTCVNKEFISAVHLFNGSAVNSYDTIRYAKDSVNQFRITLDNLPNLINERKKAAENLETINQRVGFEVPDHLIQYMIQKNTDLDPLHNAEKFLKSLNSKELKKYDELLSIPVVLYGAVNSVKYPLGTSIKGEVILKELPVKMIATEKKYVKQIKKLLQDNKRDDISVASFETSKKIDNDLKKIYFDSNYNFNQT